MLPCTGGRPVVPPASYSPPSRQAVGVGATGAWVCLPFDRVERHLFLEGRDLGKRRRHRTSRRSVHLLAAVWRVMVEAQQLVAVHSTSLT